MLIGIFFIVQSTSLLLGTLVSSVALKIAILPFTLSMSVHWPGLRVYCRTFGKYDVEKMGHSLALWQRSATQQLLVGGCGLLIGVLLLYFNFARKAMCRSSPLVEKERAFES